MNRFFVPKTNFRAGCVSMTKSQVHQLRDVLRMSSGQIITVLDNTGFEYRVKLEKLTSADARGQILDKKPCHTEPTVHLTLYQSLLKRDKFEGILQTCTELGISQFVPVVTKRTIVRTPEKVTPPRLKRWRRIITEAAEQSHRAIIPYLTPAVNFPHALRSLPAQSLALFPNLQNCPITLKQALNTAAGPVALFIGPEGGFTPREIELAKKAGAKPVSLGKRILRTETAALAAATIIFHELDQQESGNHNLKPDNN